MSDTCLTLRQTRKKRVYKKFRQETRKILACISDRIWDFEIPIFCTIFFKLLCNSNFKLSVASGRDPRKTSREDRRLLMTNDTHIVGTREEQPANVMQQSLVVNELSMTCHRKFCVCIMYVHMPPLVLNSEFTFSFSTQPRKVSANCTQNFTFM